MASRPVAYTAYSKHNVLTRPDFTEALWLKGYIENITVDEILGPIKSSPVLGVSHAKNKGTCPNAGDYGGIIQGNGHIADMKGGGAYLVSVWIKTSAVLGTGDMQIRPATTCASAADSKTDFEFKEVSEADGWIRHQWSFSIPAAALCRTVLFYTASNVRAGPVRFWVTAPVLVADVDGK
jgi:hypothetical protein